MLDKAISKIKTEMKKKADESYIQIVGDYLLKYLESHPAEAEKILDKDKTIAKSLDAMQNVASKKRKGNCAVLTDEEGFAVVLKYFGIDGAPSISANTMPAPVPEKNADVFDVRLEDLLL